MKAWIRLQHTHIVLVFSFIVFELKEREPMNNFQRAIVTGGHTRMLQMNRPIPGSKNSHFQNEA